MQEGIDPRVAQPLGKLCLLLYFLSVFPAQLGFFGVELAQTVPTVSERVTSVPRDEHFVAEICVI